MRAHLAPPADTNADSLHPSPGGGRPGGADAGARVEPAIALRLRPITSVESARKARLAAGSRANTIVLWSAFGRFHDDFGLESATPKRGRRPHAPEGAGGRSSAASPLADVRPGAIVRL